jgi:hypothetical protein
VGVGEKVEGREEATMSDDQDRKRIVDRANRMVEQSRILRKLSDELLKESRDLRVSAKDAPKKRPRKSKPSSR